MIIAIELRGSSFPETVYFDLSKLRNIYADTGCQLTITHAEATGNESLSFDYDTAGLRDDDYYRINRKIRKFMKRNKHKLKGLSSDQ